MFNTNQDAYFRFRDKVVERTASVIAWVGAGLSLPAGLPLWKGLRDSLIEALDRKIATLDPKDAGSYSSKRQLIQTEQNYWVSFRLLKDALGETSYRESIRRSLQPADTAQIPAAYLYLWRLRIAGMISLNLDRLAYRAHSEVWSNKTVVPFVGKSCGAHVHLLKSRHPFIAQLHGAVDDHSSWVFTKDEFGHLSNDKGYLSFVQSCFAAKTVVFVGMSADDVAAGEHLRKLTESGIDLGGHFWITHRSDGQTDKWAENAGLQIIRYRAPKDDHSELAELFEDLLKFVPKDDENVSPVPPNVQSATAPLPVSSELEKEPAEKVRQILNAHAAMLLNSMDPDKNKKYQEFCGQYDLPIYKAWYIKPPHDTILGYKLDKMIGSGAFAKVYRATTTTGKPDVALKLLHEEIRNDPEMLQAFRRGVKSMNILSQRKVKGMIPYRDAGEIPAFVVMELVEGYNLKEAIEKHRITAWSTVLRVAVDLARIIRSAHGVVENVLHRDIRPSNIMLRNCWEDEHEWDLVVLDFDLSWHRNATGLSIQRPNTTTGYLAPEQAEANPSESTRSAAVDSFGLGMTLYFLRTGNDPAFKQHRHANWRDTLVGFAARHLCKEWKSLPTRYFRMIEGATMDAQSQRWDMAQILGELERLQEALLHPDSVESPELLAEELASRALLHGCYEWNQDTNCASFDSPTGQSIQVLGHEHNNVVEVVLSWQQRNNAEYNKITKWLPTARDKAVAVLKRSGWKAEIGSGTSYTVRVSATMTAFDLSKKLEVAAQAVSEARECLQFNE